MLQGVAQGIVADMARAEALAEERAEPQLLALARPMLPIVPGRTPSSWVGGSPTLPAGTPWPQMDEEPGHFLCQIDCAALPAALWDGLGPRHGWLRIFAKAYLDIPEEAFTGIWTEELGTPHTGPDAGNADWIASTSRRRGGTQLTYWPLEVSQATALDLATGNRMAGFQAYRHTEGMDLLDPRFRPFNPKTLRLLIDVLRQSVTAARDFPDHWLARHKTPNAEDQAYLDAYRSRIALVVEQFEAWVAGVEARLTSAPVFPSDLEAEMQALSQIHVPRAGKQTAQVPFEEDLTPLTAAPPVLRSNWPQDYREGLYDLAKTAYVADPGSLPDAQRTFFEDVWREDAAYAALTLGATPRGFSRAEYGPEADHEMLMELTSSPLLNWMWGDTYNLVLIIRREDLARNDFSRLVGEITN